MTRDDIIRMAREANLYLDGENTQQPFWVLSTSDLERFAAIVAAAEREACAQICENMEGMAGDYGYKYADAIIARGNNESQ